MHVAAMRMRVNLERFDEYKIPDKSEKWAASSVAPNQYLVTDYGLRKSTGGGNMQ